LLVSQSSVLNTASIPIPLHTVPEVYRTTDRENKSKPAATLSDAILRNSLIMQAVEEVTGSADEFLSRHFIKAIH
jgi:hypothetical protein